METALGQGRTYVVEIGLLILIGQHSKFADDLASHVLYLPAALAVLVWNCLRTMVKCQVCLLMPA